MASYLVRTLGLVALLWAIVVGQAVAQRTRNHHWEVPGFDFRRDGVLRTRARAVRDTRARLLSTGQFSSLNQSISRARSGASQSPSSTALTGVLNVPAILFRYKDSPLPPFPESSYDEVLFAPTPTGAAAGRPYTLRSFYSEMSNGLFDIQGNAYGYANLDSAEVWYVGGTSPTCQQGNPFNSPNCNGLFSGLAIGRMQSALREALIALDAQIDFSQYAVGGGGSVSPVHASGDGRRVRSAERTGESSLGPSLLPHSSIPDAGRRNGQRLHPAARGGGRILV